MTQTKKLITRVGEFGEAESRQHSSYGSAFVDAMIRNGGLYVSDRTGITYQIPAHFGFCYGVEKSIDLAFETRRRFSKKRIFLTHDIIHNPRVNQDLLSQGVKVLGRSKEGSLLLDDIGPEDVVIIAAFGSKYDDVESLKKKECVVVDTTCGAIVAVWKRVEKYAKEGFTSVIHGIWNHEETRATASQAEKNGGHFIVIRDIGEACLIGDLLTGRMSDGDFEKKFKDRVSNGFEPGKHLKRVGIASQTTMLKSETLEIQNCLRATYAAFCPPDKLKEVFLSYHTICSATQKRQDALRGLLDSGPDLIVVIGGFNSSNTTHLSEIASAKFPTYHIQGPEDILSPEAVRHLCPKTLKQKVSPWRTAGLKRVGIMTGASTPDLLIEKVIKRLETCLK